MNRFCLDADTLIQAKNGPYGFDIAPRFWEWLASRLSDGTIFTSRLVYDEWIKGDDELAGWVENMKDAGCFIEPDENTQRAYREIADYVNGRYVRHQVSLFLKGADAWVIAQARIESAIVATQETLVPDNSTRIKIPNVCQQFGVLHVNLYEMMRRLGANL